MRCCGGYRSGTGSWGDFGCPYEVKKPGEGIVEFTVLETKSMGKHEILLWPSLVYPGGTATMCIAIRGSERMRGYHWRCEKYGKTSQVC
ncbi:hypothetical protein O0I10_011740 [Lichtheimia ornata]|uniref:Uncharacterized protein n=1 Tax=Lichtheimia ornata TaxID=688661 RepID=A0AAD7XQ65_9FUNG|nr:uncharacterized protein O0I10_011740 [Lichtheimia ornata]KAJ8652594.1 hypothetical protein O0I10_011740 [Lichtheimia ornata]